MSTHSLIVTSATGVDVELAIAGPGSRAYAFIIDWHIRLLLAVIWFGAASLFMSKVSHFGAKSPAVLIMIATLPATALYFLYHPIVELLMRGQTPGKRMAGVRIVDRQGGAPSTVAVLIRNAFRLIDCLPVLYGVGLITTIFDTHRARFGDLAAGTLLVHDGDSEAHALAQLGSLSLNPALDPGTAALGNDLLLRWKELEPDARRRLARELLTRIGGAVGQVSAPPYADSVDDPQLQQQLRNALSGRAP
jgi:uncharacterized RDD family membrane protein YckC